VADLHALGVVFYRVLTGRHPFNLDSPKLLTEIAYMRPDRPMEVQPVPFGLSKVVMHLLEKDPEERYRNGEELKGDLEALCRVADANWDAPYTILRTGQEYGDAGGAPRVPGLDSDEADTAEPREQPSNGPGTLTATTPLRAAGVHSADEGGLASVPWPTTPAIAPELGVAPTAAVPPARLLPSRPGRHWLPVGIAAALVLAGIGAGLGWWSHPASDSPPTEEPTTAPVDGALAKGTVVSSPVSKPSPSPVKKTIYRARRAAALTAAAALTGLACPSVRTRPDDDLQWLASCPAESREVVRILHLNPGSPNDEGPAVTALEEGPNVKIPRVGGCEVKEGPVEVEALMDPGDASGTLVGSIIIGADRAHFRFNELRLPDGRKYPICAIGADSFLRWGPGVLKVDEKAPGRAPVSELHPGYTYLYTGRLRIRLAPYLGNQAAQGANVN
jgi:serine/threonine-protein kinase